MNCESAEEINWLAPIAGTAEDACVEWRLFNGLMEAASFQSTSADDVKSPEAPRLRYRHRYERGTGTDTQVTGAPMFALSLPHLVVPS